MIRPKLIKKQSHRKTELILFASPYESKFETHLTPANAQH